LNPYSLFRPEDFKSSVSTNSTTSATGYILSACCLLVNYFSIVEALAVFEYLS